MMRRMRAGALRQDLQDRVRVLLEPVERVVDELLGYVGVPEIAERVDKHHLGIEEPVSSPRAGLLFTPVGGSAHHNLPRFTRLHSGWCAVERK
jgi:hypothetical protein